MIQHIMNSNSGNDVILYVFMSCELEVENAMLTQLRHQHESERSPHSDQQFDRSASMLTVSAEVGDSLGGRQYK